MMMITSPPNDDDHLLRITKSEGETTSQRFPNFIVCITCAFMFVLLVSYLFPYLPEICSDMSGPLVFKVGISLVTCREEAGLRTIAVLAPPAIFRRERLDSIFLPNVGLLRLTETVNSTLAAGSGGEGEASFFLRSFGWGPGTARRADSSSTASCACSEHVDCAVLGHVLSP